MLPAVEDVSSAKDFGELQAVAFTRGGKIIAGCVFNRFREMKHGNDIHLTFVANSRMWARDGVVMRTVFGYVFDVAGCKRVTAIVREGNERSAKLVKALGFRKEGVVRCGYNGRTNALIFGMLKRECVYLENANV